MQEDDIGKTVLHRNMSDYQFDIFMRLISFEGFEFINIIYKETKNKELVIKLLDILASENLKFPTRKKVLHVLEKARIYEYLKNRDFSPEAYTAVSRDTGKRVLQIENMMTIVKRDLGD